MRSRYSIIKGTDLESRTYPACMLSSVPCVKLCNKECGKKEAQIEEQRTILFRKKSKRWIKLLKRRDEENERKLASHGDISRIWARPTDPDPYA